MFIAKLKEKKFSREVSLDKLTMIKSNLVSGITDETSVKMNIRNHFVVKWNEITSCFLLIFHKRFLIRTNIIENRSKPVHLCLQQTLSYFFLAAGDSI